MNILFSNISLASFASNICQLLNKKFLLETLVNFCNASEGSYFKGVILVVIQIEIDY